MADAAVALPIYIDDSVTVDLAGPPQGKGRARAFRRGNFIGHYTPEKTRTYEGMIRTAAMQAMVGRQRFEGPVRVEITAIFDVPASYSKKRRANCLANREKPTKKPDIDNIIKAWVDAMNGVVFRDDVQIVRGEYAKIYGPAAMVVATIRSSA